MYLIGSLAKEEKGNAKFKKNNYMNWQRVLPCSAKQKIQRIQHSHGVLNCSLSTLGIILLGLRITAYD